MKNISHAQGMFEQKDDGRWVFLYLANETLVEIDAPNEKLIEEVIGKWSNYLFFFFYTNKTNTLFKKNLKYNISHAIFFKE